MSCAMMRIWPMRAPNPSSSAKLGPELAGSGNSCARTAAPAPASARPSSRPYCSRQFLINGRASFAHHAAPLLIVGARVVEELLRAHRHSLDTAGAEARLQLGIAQRLGDLGIQPLNDFRRHAGGTDDAQPERRFVARDAALEIGRAGGRGRVRLAMDGV